MPSRRQRRQTGPLYRAIVSPNFGVAAIGLQAARPSSRSISHLAISARLTAKRSLSVLYASALWRTASVVRNRRYIANHANFEPCRRQRSDCRLTPRSGTAYAHIDRSHAVVPRLVGSVHRRLLRGERGSFAGTAEAERTGALP